MDHYIHGIVVDIESFCSFHSSLAKEFNNAYLLIIEVVSLESFDQIFSNHFDQVLYHIFRVEENSVAVDWWPLAESLR